MTAVAVTARTPVQDRLIRILGATAYGLHPEDDCEACPAGGKCVECAQDLADVDAANAGISAVQDARTEAEAEAAYDACTLALRLRGITSGGDAGTENAERGIR